MIETIQIPVLLKAIDFVFDEGRKILEDRRERRKNEDSLKNENQEQAREIAPRNLEKEDEGKQDLLASKIDELLWKNHQEEVESLVTQLGKHTQNYHILKEQSAAWGSALVPPVILLQIKDKENAIIETVKELEDILSKVYKKDIHPIK